MLIVIQHHVQTAESYRFPCVAASCVSLLLCSVNIAYLRRVESCVPCGGDTNPRQRLPPVVSSETHMEPWDKARQAAQRLIFPFALGLWGQAHLDLHFSCVTFYLRDLGQSLNYFSFSFPSYTARLIIPTSRDKINPRGWMCVYSQCPIQRQ